MFGTLLTLKGVQEKNIFVDELGRSYKLINSWVCPGITMEKYVQIRKWSDEYWFLVRNLLISINRDN